ncbi:Gfo/Idh/MocA family protein [Pedobacter xixiisoli]|uniref:Predicted dehydrogenase n=1 Tax=Pedobacter xixiisoli TaxID=1476464 RepID=A0A286AEK7_9SPHI|nr:Gfo/Idh/MocA family oxidoreductase [Pedobacter xixiisoli]SOD20333.1 Predicted dehydrogenase [Pedobacter xixiisoli]
MKIKFAILGYGHIGKRHAELVSRHPDAELVATIDIVSSTNLRASEFKVPHFTSIDDFLKSDIGVDVVNICTPNGFHASQAIKCLEQGKHVVIEKPIALNKADAEKILEAANKNSRFAFPVVQNRYSSTVKWLKEIVSDGRLGEIFMVQLNCFWNRDEHYYTKGGWHGTLALDGGPLYTQFSHFIDVLNWIFGDVKNINARFSNFNHQHNTEFEDSGVVTFDFLKGGMGSINYSTSIYQSNFESSITVVGQNGTVKIGGQYMNSLEYCLIKGAERPILKDNQMMNDYGAYKGSASNHHLVVDNVIKSINGFEEQHVSLSDGLKVVDIIDRIYTHRDARITKKPLRKEQLTT